jgi:hypothetical protein
MHMPTMTQHQVDQHTTVHQCVKTPSFGLPDKQNSSEVFRVVVVA